MSSAAGSSGIPIRNNLSQDDKRAVIDRPLESTENGAIKYRELVKTALQFGTKRASVSNLWKFYRQQRGEGIQNPDLSCCHKLRDGRKKVDMALYREIIKQVRRRRILVH